MLTFSVIVPDAVIGLPLTDKSVEATDTLVTVPALPAATQDVLEPSVERTFPALDVCDGKRAFSAAFAVV